MKAQRPRTSWTPQISMQRWDLDRGDVAMVQELERLMKPKVLTKVELEEPAQRSLNSLES